MTLTEGVDYYMIDLGNGWEGKVGINSCAGFGGIGHKDWKRKNNPIGKALRSIANNDSTYTR